VRDTRTAGREKGEERRRVPAAGGGGGGGREALASELVGWGSEEEQAEARDCWGERVCRVSCDAVPVRGVLEGWLPGLVLGRVGLGLSLGWARNGLMGLANQQPVWPSSAGLKRS
jgi:hypothetical protein